MGSLAPLQRSPDPVNDYLPYNHEVDCTPTDLRSMGNWDDFGNTKASEDPDVRSLEDLLIVQYIDVAAETRQIHFFYLTNQDFVFFGRLPSSDPSEPSLDDYTKQLRRVSDEKLFPRITDTDAEKITQFSGVQDPTMYLKRPGLLQYQPEEDNGTPKLVLDEAEVMETLERNPHPNIIGYHGCRVRRNLITGIVLDRHQKTLEQFAREPEFKEIDRDDFFDAFKSAVEHLHRLGLAHNDINPGNIMVSEDRTPVMIDFGSCQPFGELLQTFGTPGWHEEDFWTSEKEHDLFSLRRLREWLNQEM
ncbi:putative serine/threonine-protein kinase mkcB [Colletotrichum spinosum]|uniref:Putative serine/threonine-protein kinase mkcB n=1 Tax=Colletotrichum spinosum TaxID=1347390 RepID=A0A4R8Q441_9PEZI|nr:putative serine/threonine-protein kinase mkcB [Colletotrichum spinosum]